MFICYDDRAPEIWYAKEYRIWVALASFLYVAWQPSYDPHKGPSDCYWMVPGTIDPSKPMVNYHG